MFRVSGLTFSFGEKPLYEKVNFVVGEGQKIGLVGPNGSGKSTLLNILIGREEGYNGKIETRGSISLVPQEVKYDADMLASETVREYIDREMKFEGYELHKLFAGLELDTELGANPNKLSGGQKTKLALARALLSRSDTLLLDEPTNFMDKAGKKWVMHFLSEYQGTVIVISHDLELMDKAIDKVLAINPVTKTIDEYKGNYTQFLRLKKEKEELVKRQILIKQKHITRMEKGLSKMKRLTSGKGVRRRVQQQRRIEKEKLELPALPLDVRKIKMSLPEPSKVGEIPIRTFGLSKSYGDLEVLTNLDFTIIRGERIALIGPNGSGKSTFIKILMGIVEPDAGEVVINPQSKIGYYSQEFETFDFRKRVIDAFVEDTHRDEGFARSFLGRYMFMGDKVFQRIESLSGGEKTRLSIAMLTAKDNNLLILDEPTTYLDVLSQRIILETLKEYGGTMIIVSHTQEFMAELAPQKALLFPEGKMVYWDTDLLDRIIEV
ncbi:hypothetical protein A3A76_04725 [Candidatus Woesebacteria bacterium RIFCSPLOWO2_01_FULL_39_23]|uniref:ABC transporter domain-containing protein n=2 Tax=Microgenomates group TaxID=1794810 RepID=A0A1F7YMA1_9BACT|nr:putative ATPase component of ABC transporter with duplicated ATPase-like protein [uncultured Microgenomates bacterium Rifle_16ft_4_minimus_37633]OGM13788.1 MAG: hypothetical protein A2141_03950 [Candidatus Woesebacteria bacterium RBG_16_40_11]OGM27738.1 MAG: hypothetical protein A2628_04945 [Candidatus Woesebacteria bacterium RIFCSPHIGHO2_01_FULL_40_22]OGM36004.1 MAG: hypothetical protein A3E41_01200 [Candidatus Woesebacteria bacterium RIFCSPHIGHO2_12_FULL_38_9]OGM62160.1 MAG: hypothetical p